MYASRTIVREAYFYTDMNCFQKANAERKESF